MQNESKNLSQRLLDFAANVIKFSVKYNKTSVGRYLINQLIRSAASAGANYEEACGAESRSDFIHKMQIVLKELRESLYWLKLIKQTELSSDGKIQELINETDELIKIIAKSVITAKRNIR
jgi:four helix bundle protein